MRTDVKILLIQIFSLASNKHVQAIKLVPEIFMGAPKFEEIWVFILLCLFVCNCNRLLLALAIQYNLEVQMIDVKGTYLNSKLNDEIYIKQQEEFTDGTN